ncbi:hypothetical protein B9Z19DRAFT_1080722 [Tuber borchii]|uniref:Uncharacterized protein n=1 Tax=Tuber borchii TaxID=42251 RepID=A0A2T6ZWJ8_TUBBO|nr:hypothetical protein B9Z19DRAFT_1080722 [Tuber borchii]
MKIRVAVRVASMEEPEGGWKRGTSWPYNVEVLIMLMKRFCFVINCMEGERLLVYIYSDNCS